MSFDFNFFIFRFSNVLSVNAKSLFELSSGLSDIFLIVTAVDNYIYKIGSFAIDIRFQNKKLLPILNFKEFRLCNIIKTNNFFSIFFCYIYIYNIYTLYIHIHKYTYTYIYIYIYISNK